MNINEQCIAIALALGATWHEVPPISGWILDLPEEERKGFERIHPKRILSFHDWPFNSPRCAPLPFPDPETGDAISIPDYLNDLNAIRSAIDYARTSLRNMDKDLFWCDGEFSVQANSVLGRAHYDDDIPLMLITAPQYCEIFLRTLNLWTED